MNMVLNIPALDAATFENLVVANGFLIQGNTVYFSLVHPAASDISVNAVVEANDKKEWTILNNTSDPQNDVEKDFYTLAVDENSRPIIESFDSVLAVQNMPFRLIETQIDRLNLLLKEHFEEEFLKGFTG